jgi:histidine triad (HIT) family protein
MDSCVFCNVSLKRLNHLIGEDESSIAFLDRNPIARGHVLVIPKKHVEKVDELSSEELRNYFVFISRVEKAVIEFAGVGGGCDIINHYHPFLEESELVKKHLHFHIIPRHFNDGVFRGERLSLSDDEMKAIALKLSSILKNQRD